MGDPFQTVIMLSREYHFFVSGCFLVNGENTTHALQTLYIFQKLGQQYSQVRFKAARLDWNLGRCDWCCVHVPKALDITGNLYLSSKVFHEIVRSCGCCLTWTLDISQSTSSAWLYIWKTIPRTWLIACWKGSCTPVLTLIYTLFFQGYVSSRSIWYSFSSNLAIDCISRPEEDWSDCSIFFDT